MPQTIGRYHVVEELGRGAMGVVYRAEDPVIGRTVALKTLHESEGASEAAGRELRERFLREARAAGRLQHPGIVAVLDAGTDEATGISYIAMEFVDGTDLDAELRAGRRFTPDEAVEVAAAVADALDYAHAEGVVHRDIKPANLLIDRSGRVRIADFGIAHLADSGLTRTGQVLGSPAYMSPEQVTGAPVDGRSDIFSLGVVLYQLLVGERPFQGEAMSTLAYQIVHTEPAPVRKLNPMLAPIHEQVLARALAKQPAARYQRARDLADDLRGATVLGVSEPAPGRRGATGTLIAEPPAAGEAAAGVATAAGGTLVDHPPEPTRGRPRRPLAAVATLAAAVVIGITAVMLSGRDRNEPDGAADPAGVDRALPADVGNGEVAAGAAAAEVATPAEAARLAIDFDHHLSSGQVTLSVDGADVWSSPLHAVKKRRIGIPGLKKGPSIKLANQLLRDEIEVPSGSHLLAVRVVSKPSGIDELEAVRAELEPGGSATLRIRVARLGHGLSLEVR